MNVPLVFSTLACPDWPVETVIANGAAYGYQGIEWRGGPQGHINPSSTAGERRALRDGLQAAGLFAHSITAYSSFISPDPAERGPEVDELCRYADLAAEIGARYVRAFLGELPPGLRPDEAMTEWMAESLQAAAVYAGSVGVGIVIEPHDDFVRSALVAPILARVTDPPLGVIWDVGNTHAAGEDPAETIGLLREHLAYAHVKDGRGRGDTWQLCPLGEGEVPLARIFALLSGSGFEGALCVEWEWAWHPELDPPEVALPHAIQSVRSLLAELDSASPIHQP